MLPNAVFAHRLTISKVGEWGTGAYNKVFVNGNYAYCAAGYAGLDIIDIANPAKPKKIANYDTPGYAGDVVVKGNYAYAADGQNGLNIIDITSPSSPKSIAECDTPGSGSGVYVYGRYAYIADGYSGLQIINISSPSAPILAGNFAAPHKTNGVFVAGNYAYVIMGEWDSEIDEVFGGLIILDISNPTSPQQLGTLNFSCASGIYVSGNYAYITIAMGNMTSGGLMIIDVKTPSSPMQVKFLQASNAGYHDIDIKGNYAYCAGDFGKNLVIFDIGSPTKPTLIGSASTPGNGRGVHTGGNYTYVADSSSGLQVLNINDPTYPFITGKYDNSGDMGHLCINGDYAYTGNNDDGELQVIDVSHPSSPNRVATYDNPDRNMRGLFVKGKYAYVGYSGNELQVIDITAPTSPVLSGIYENSKSWYPAAIAVSTNYAYVADYQRGLTILDISTPAAPTLVKNHAISRGPNDIYVKGNYAYMTVILAGLKIIDIAAPSSPVTVGSLDLPENVAAVFVNGNYAYVASAEYGTPGGFNDRHGTLYIIDVANPASPAVAGYIVLPEAASDVYVSGNYAYVTCGLNGLKAIDISNPASPSPAASYDTSGPARRVSVKGNYIYVANGESGKLLVLQGALSETPARIHLNRDVLNFAAIDNGLTANPQTFYISNTGESALEWSAAADREWLHCSPANGIDSGEVTVSVVNVRGLAAGTYTGEITVSDPDADNSPQKIAVTLNVLRSGETSVPFGQFDTPLDGATVSSSIPVTGWVLDDFSVQTVLIFWGEPGSLNYIGNAVFVEGARPDVEEAFPGYPMNDRAGWGYMLLTHFLPDANGVFTLYALAIDAEGNQVTLGTKTITVDNDHAVKPFGAIDTPAQGRTVSGPNYMNFGWVLTPQPNTIPIDGSTIHAWVDGIELGNPVYNQYREDIAALFPGYNNSGGAVGSFVLDTTPYANGVHTIYWTAADNAGNSEGIGSRYFSIRNTGTGTSGRGAPPWSLFPDSRSSVSDRIPPAVDGHSPVRVGKGYDPDMEPQQVYPDTNGTIRVEIKELERIVIRFADEKTAEPGEVKYAGYLSVGNRLKPLPVGSTMDIDAGIFYWQPGPGFIGRYRFVFFKKDSHGQMSQKEIVVDIIPKFITRSKVSRLENIYLLCYHKDLAVQSFEN